MRLASKYIGRDWSRLYWQLPFYPARGNEEISKDINQIDDKYHRGDVYQVSINFNKFMSYISIVNLLLFYIGSSS
jgi:hypothetical protein